MAKCHLSVDQLKKELGRRGAATTGRKTDLIERLEAYERNQDFRGPIIVLPPEDNRDWPDRGFNQLLKEHKTYLPKITKEQVEGYFIYRIGGDVQLQNSQRKLSGDPIQSHCECPSGKGPHGTCKHTAAILLMIQDFTETGNQWIQKTCTETLQSFHCPKSLYEGKPIKAEDLPSKRKLNKDELLEDPRPAKYRRNEGYNDFVRSALINYCAHTSQDIALRYNYGSANIQIASMDHDYLELPLTERIIDHGNLVSSEEAKKIEKETRNQSNSKLWFKH
ncbi:uncharacterized protein LOC144625336 isoform X3 [Crassostrea virginica]